MPPSIALPSIAFVGAGPTTIYTLHALVAHAAWPCAVTIFEEQASPGRGTPYRPGWNDAAMLSNIASIEIPPLEETLVAWLTRQAPARLRALGVDPDAIDERAFYPRLALGEYLQDQFHALIARAATRGVAVEVRSRALVSDVAMTSKGAVLSVRPRRGDAYTERFDQVVLATGHQWPDDPQVRPGYFLSPWPASALAAIPAGEVGIRGTSLTAIDAVVALAVAHGAFVEIDGDRLRYEPGPAGGALRITMLSRKGLLPEADFYHPLPYEPLSILTPAAAERLIAGPDDELLDQGFALFKRELAAADPEYAAKIGLDGLALEDFCERYFADRVAVDPFVWAEANLREAERNYAAHVTVPWRYAILRMHEVMALLVPHLNERDFERFSKQFKPIFVDDYATVPHESIKRLLALHEAGTLAIMAVGDDYRIDSRSVETGAELRLDGERRHFPVFIEATGQRPLAARDFPFPSLRQDGIIRDASPNEAGAGRGIAIDEQFHPVSPDAGAERLFCLSLPFLLGRHPFIQGITSSHEMGAIVGEELAGVVGKGVERVKGIGRKPPFLKAKA